MSTPARAARRRALRGLLALIASLGGGPLLAQPAPAAPAGPAGSAGGLPALVARSKPSVLPVGTFSPTDSPRFGFRGSGFVVADGEVTESRWVVTNFHVLPEAQPGASPARMAVWVGGSASPPWRLARVLATDRLRDLALLEVDGPALPALRLAPAAAAQEGQAIALMGFPIGSVLGYSVVTHRGIVSSITTAALPAANARQLDPRAVSRLREGNFGLLQLDATAYPGNSGGPVFDVDTGLVLGVVSMVLVKGGRESALSNPTGITYAVPSGAVAALLREPREPGEPR